MKEDEGEKYEESSSLPAALNLLPLVQGPTRKFIAGLAPWRSNDDTLGSIRLHAAAWDIVCVGLPLHAVRTRSTTSLCHVLL